MNRPAWPTHAHSVPSGRASFRPHAAEVLPQTHSPFSRYFTVAARFTGLEVPTVRYTLSARVPQRAKGSALKTFHRLIQP
jgi:hypothetical protein